MEFDAKILHSFKPQEIENEPAKIRHELIIIFCFRMEIVNSMSVDTGSSKKASLAKMAAVTGASTRNSSVSSMTSMSSHGSFNSSNLNHALAMVNNQLDREQRKQDQEATRKLTLLRQRKISAVLKVRILKKLSRYPKISS